MKKILLVCLFLLFATYASAANFYVLTVNKTGTGCTITSTPSGIVAGTTTTAYYDAGTVVTLGGYVENGWNSTIVYGGHCASNGTVTMDGAKTCTATCTEKKVTTFAPPANAIASGSVTRANMKLSAVDGTAFVDFSTAGVLTNYAANKYRKLTVTDSAGKKLTGYIKAAGSGETYGSELVTNGNMETGDPPSDWTAHYNAVLDGVADERTDGTGSQSLEVTAGTTGWYASQGKTVVAGGLYRNTYWGKTITGAGFKVGFFGTGTTFNPSVINSATWLYVEQYVRSGGTSFILAASCTGASTSNGGTQRFDDISLKQVLTPAATGVTITSTADGTTYNWASKDADFNYNDASGYTYTITRE